MESLIKIDSKVKHLPSGNICTILKINDKTYKVSRLKKGYTTIYEDTLVKKSECEFYVEPPKVKSAYEIYRERVAEMAKNLPALPKETSQTILWLKSAIIEKVENVDKLTDSNIYTFKKNEDNPETKKFGFSEQYVNLLMEMAYNEGRRRATEEVTESHMRESAKMKTALDKIKDALDEADWIEYPEY